MTTDFSSLKCLLAFSPSCVWVSLPPLMTTLSLIHKKSLLVPQLYYLMMIIVSSCPVTKPTSSLKATLSSHNTIILSLTPTPTSKLISHPTTNSSPFPLPFGFTLTALCPPVLSLSSIFICFLTLTSLASLCALAVPPLLSCSQWHLPPHLIQAIGRWASPAFQIYIQKNPVLLQALLFRQNTHEFI